MQSRGNPSSSPEQHAAQIGPWLGGWHLLVPILVLAIVRDLWAPDEPRYAQIAKEAWDSHSFLVLHLCGEPYPDKPPLVYWLAGLMGRMSGWSEAWMRLPSILATIGSAWLCARIARRWLGEIEARWAVLFYLGTVMVLEIGGRLQLDPVMSFFVLAAIDLLSIDGGGERAIVRRTLAAGLFAGFAALAKGPPAWVPIGFAILAWRFLPQPLRYAPRRGARAWTGFVLLAILPVATWAALAIREQPDLLRPLLFGQHIGRITKGDQHPGPVWNHLISMPVLLLPWTLLVLAGLARAWRAFRAREEPGFVRIAAWFAVVFVFFSLIPPKRDLYLLPIYPAAALIAARELAVALRAARMPGWIGWTTGILMLVAGLALACAPVLVSAFVHMAQTEQMALDARAWASLAVPAGIALTLGAVAALIGQTFRSPRLWANALALGMATALTAAAVWLVPAIDDVKSARKLAEMLRARPERPSQIPCVGLRPEGIRFYGGGPAAAEPLVPAVEREGDQFLGLATDKDFDRLSPADRARFRILGQEPLGRRNVYLLGRSQP